MHPVDVKSIDDRTDLVGTNRLDLNAYCGYPCEAGSRILVLIEFNDGRQGFLVDAADAESRPLGDTLCAIVTDVEMPFMDGYVLTQHIKADRRFDGVPVMMHSSLSSVKNRRLGMQVGADAYLPKLDPMAFSQMRGGLIGPGSPAVEPTGSGREETLPLQAAA